MMSLAKTSNVFLREIDSLNSDGKVFAFYTTRKGGYGKGLYATMNCTHYCGDDMDDVCRNRKLLVESLDADIKELIIPRQTHGDKVLVIDNSFENLDETEKTRYIDGVDALVTDVRGYCIAISTADCVPVLIYSPKGVVAAVHAGWRGTVAKIVTKCINVMQQKFGCKAEDMKVFVGPSISVDAFEVGDEVYDAFENAGFDMDKVSIKNGQTGKWHLDLWKANCELMKNEGVVDCNIEIAGICTWSNSDIFFSARKLGINSGRMLSGIVIK